MSSRIALRFSPALPAALLFTLAGPALAQTSLTSAQINQRVEELLARLTLAEKIDLLGGVNGTYVRSIPHIGLPSLKMSDGPMGARNGGPATAMAGGIALAATWNVALAKQVGLEIGRDARARGVHFVLGPGVNIYLAPMNGRNFEYFGEDPFLAAQVAVAYIQGMQSQGVSATIKHFVGNNSEFDRHNTDSVIEERALREIYLPAFEAAVKQAHVGAIMDSYNFTNGEHMSQNARLNTDIAKKEWNFDGILMSDWFSTYDGIAAANAGLDLEMPFGANMNRGTLLPAIESGKVSVAVIDDKVRRILRTAIRFGWLDREQADPGIPLWNGPANQTALQSAREAIVLLKNDGGLLPLNQSKIRSIAVIGPDAYPAVPGGGGSAQVRPFTPVSFLEGLAAKLGPQVKVFYRRGIPTWSQLANSTPFLTAANEGKPGVTVETYDNPDFSGTPSTRVARHMSQRARASFASLGSSDPGEAFVSRGPRSDAGSSARWTGYYIAKSSGNFEVFAAVSGESGGHRLSIDGRPVLDSWIIRKALIEHIVVPLSAGPHQVVLEQFEPGRPNIFGGGVEVGIAPEESLVDPAAKTIAAQADAVVIAAGFDPESESEGADRTFSLPFGQDELIREISAANKNTIVVVTSGGAVDTSAWLDRVPALLEAWYPGQEGGVALAEILLGDVNPSGRLPISFDRRWEDNPSFSSYYPEPGTRRVVYHNGVFVGYRGYDRSGAKPFFPFGYGLSYTSFHYSRLNIRAIQDNPAGPQYEVSFDVDNNNRSAGADVCQLYIGDAHAKVPRPPRELKGFAKVELQPGETKTVRIRLDGRSFSYYDTAAKHWRADAGKFQVLIGRSSADIELEGQIVLPHDLVLE